MRIQELETILGELANEIKFDIQMQQLRLFLMVAASPGITQTELAERLKLHQATVSRNVTKMSSVIVEKEGGGFQKVGWGILITRQDSRFDSRRLACFLSPEGETIIHKLNRTLKRVTGEEIR